MNAERIPWIDSVKFSGIFMVVFYHVVNGLDHSGIEIPGAVFETHRIISDFHVPLFFVVSGFFFAAKYSDREVLSFTLKKWDRLIYLCLLWSVLQGVVQVAFTGYTNEPHNLSDVFSLSLVLNPKDQFWFLYALFYVTASSAVLYRLGGNALVLLVVSFCLFFAANRLGGMVALTLTHFVYFAIGVSLAPVLREHLGALSRKITVGAVFVCFFLLQSCTSLWLENTQTAPNNLWHFTAAVSGTLLVLTVCSNLPQTGMKWTGYIGRHSMEIFLMHVMSAAGARIILLRVFGLHDFWILLPVCIAAGLLLPILSSIAIRRSRLKFLLSCPDRLSLQKQFSAHG